MDAWTNEEIQALIAIWSDAQIQEGQNGMMCTVYVCLCIYKRVCLCLYAYVCVVCVSVCKRNSI